MLAVLGLVLLAFGLGGCCDFVYGFLRYVFMSSSSFFLSSFLPFCSSCWSSFDVIFSGLHAFLRGFGFLLFLVFAVVFIVGG